MLLVCFYYKKNFWAFGLQVATDESSVIISGGKCTQSSYDNNQMQTKIIISGLEKRIWISVWLF